MKLFISEKVSLTNCVMSQNRYLLCTLINDHLFFDIKCLYASCVTDVTDQTSQESRACTIKSLIWFDWSLACNMNMKLLIYLILLIIIIFFLIYLHVLVRYVRETDFDLFDRSRCVPHRCTYL